MRKLAFGLVFAAALRAQVYSPKVLREGQPDPTDLKKFAAEIYAQAGAHTERERAEAIWRFFLTDGRFVKPGYWYHIAGWTYEEPTGEVLDPMKLLNSYGFGLCYHIAPLLEAVFEAGGFADARCWFLTGHTVTEVFYGGGYHYFDSDMMGYNVAGDGPFQGKRVSSVRDVEGDSGIMLSKLAAPDQVKPQVVDNPWYPADVRARAIGDLANLFTTTADNYLYPYTRYSTGHSMDFVLRPGEKLIRFFKPEEPGLFYLPYTFDGKRWTEFPQEVPEYKIRTADGPRSQKDERLWATGRIEYTPPLIVDQAVTVIDMPSPYVIIDARFSIDVELPTRDESLRVETSTDGGVSWAAAGELRGPHRGEFVIEPQVLATSAHGRLTAVSGSYDYKVRITKSGSGRVNALHLLSRIQVNPRSLPAVEAGENRYEYSSAAPIERIAIAAPLNEAPAHGFELDSQSGQRILRPSRGEIGEVVYALQANGRTLTGFEAGARFLDLKIGLAPNKLTAETRKVATTVSGEASLGWSISAEGPFQELWKYPQKLQWRDGDPISRLLLWPEVFRQLHELPVGTKRVYVRFRSSGPALDNIRLAVYAQESQRAGRLKVSQVWSESGVQKEHDEEFDATSRDRRFVITAAHDVQNEQITLAAQ